MSKKKTILAVILFAALIAGAALAYFKLAPKAQLGSKTVTVQIVHGDGSEKELTFRTDAEYLGEILRPDGLVQGTEGEFGMYVTTVDGETADEDIQQWWGFYSDGEMLMYGMDELPVADGEHYEIILQTGW